LFFFAQVLLQTWCAESTPKVWTMTPIVTTPSIKSLAKFRTWYIKRFLFRQNCRQFHQHFTRAFFVWKCFFLIKRNERKAVQSTFLRKMRWILMKLTPGGKSFWLCRKISRHIFIHRAYVTRKAVVLNLFELNAH